MEHQIEWRHYRYFLAVAEELHFRRAAERLFITQPGLSRQIAQLEDRLGVQLFERDKRKVQLTPAGAFLQQEINFVARHLSQTRAQLHRIQAGEQGEIRIGFIGTAMQKVIPNLLARLTQAHPLINSSLEEMSIGEQVAAVQQDELDVGFVRLENVARGLQMKAVEEDSFSLVVPASHPISDDNFASLAQFREEAFILFSKDYSPIYYDKIVSICEDHGFSPRISHKSVHALTIFRLVEKKLGVAIVPSALQDGFDLNIRFLELKNIRQKAVLSIIWNPQHRNPSLEHFLALLPPQI
ncbi:MAG: LysR family transcriptional regulator [Bacteroidota bacterium]